MSAAPTTMQWLRTAARRITAGTTVLAGRLIRRSTKTARTRGIGLRAGISAWMGESTGALEALLRWAMLAGAAWISWFLVRLCLGAGAHILTHARWLLWPAAVWYLVAAYRAGNPAETPKPDAETAGEPDEAETAEQPIPDVPRPVFLALLYAELGDGRAVHLARAARALARHYTEYPWDVPAVAALCAAHQITTVDKVRAHGKGATRGVRREALPAVSSAPPAAPAVDVDVAGQDPSTGPSTATSTPPSTGPDGEGQKGFVVVDDEANPVRAHVHWTLKHRLDDTVHD